MNYKVLRVGLFLMFFIAVSFFVFFYFFKDRVMSPNTQVSFVQTTIENKKSDTNQPVVLDNDYISFSFGGDMMLDRAVDYNFPDGEIFNIFSDFDKDIFRKKDISFVNLEGPISLVPINHDQTANNMIFNFPPKTPEVLLDLGINTVSLANNHSNNNGTAGLQNTRTVLLGSGIKPLGQENDFSDLSIGRFQKNNLSVSVITINCLEVSRDITKIIAGEKNRGSKVIIFPHWGEEYQLVHSAKQELVAKSWIDAGADMVIGSHPHVVEDAMIYKLKPVFYSLGNFVFDQTFSSETMRGLVLTGKVYEDKIEVNAHFVESSKLKPRVMKRDSANQFLLRLYKYFSLTDTNLPLSFLLNEN